MPDRDVRALAETSDGSLLVATGGGAVRFNASQAESSSRFTLYPLPEGIKVRSVEAVAEQGASVWIGTDAGLFVSRGSNRRTEPVPLDGASVTSVRVLAGDANGNLWVGSTAGLFIVNPGGQPHAVSLALPSCCVTALMPEGPNLWIGTTGGLLKGHIQRTGIQTDGEALLKNVEVRSLLRAPDGSLWIGTRLGVFHQDADGAPVRALGEAEGLPKGDAAGLAVDGTGDVWVAYDGYGAVRVSSTGFVTYDAHDGVPPAQISCLTLTRRGTPLTTTDFRPGLSALLFEQNRFEPVRISGTPVKEASLFPGEWTPWHQAIAADGFGGIWTGSHGEGLLEFRETGQSHELRLRAAHRDTPPGDVARVFADSRGNIWFSTLPIVAFPAPGQQTGLGVWSRSTGRIRTFTEADGLPPRNSFAILYFTEDHAGEIWIGLYRTGVARWRDGRFQIFTAADGVPVGGIRFIYEDHKHRLWLASGRGGLGRIDDPLAAMPSIRRYTAADGLASDEIQTITEDNFGRIYVGTGFGVDRIDPESGRIVHYTAANGLAPGEVQDAVRDAAGDLWFGTYKAVSRLHPRPDPPLQPAPVKIGAVRINGQPEPISFTASRVVTRNVPPGSNSIQIEYFALALAGTENIRYQYQLSGADTAWSAPVTTRSTLYSNLPPGSYVFEVRSLNPLPGDAASVAFTVLPHFWEHWWFLTAVGASLLLAIYGAYWYRLQNLLALQHMRTRLARDLHDDIGSGLSKIVIMSEVSQRSLAAAGAAGSAAEQLDRIAETSREVLDAVGDLVWATNAAAEKIEDLIRRMRSFATQLFEAQGVAFELDCRDVPTQKVLSPEALRQVYLIFKEAVNNAAKHSGCRNAAAELRISRDGLSLRITDDGAGFEPAPKPGHHGLESMRARARSLGGEIVWRKGENGMGTTVELTIPDLDRPVRID